MVEHPLHEKIVARLFVPAYLGAGALVYLESGQAHYLKNVMRAKPGIALGLFNGRDGEWIGRLEDVGKNKATVAIEEMVRPQIIEPDIWLAFAPVKRARLDFIAQKATELGVSALWPVMTARTIVDRVKTDRLRANAIEAAEQTDRLTIPEVFDSVKLEAMIGQWPADRPLILCDETGTAPLILEALKSDKFVENGPAGLLIGPEGGFADWELDELRKLDFVTPVGLGPRLLRADTAALAALTCWQAVIGDWQ